MIGDLADDDEFLQFLDTKSKLNKVSYTKRMEFVKKEAETSLATRKETLESKISQLKSKLLENEQKNQAMSHIGTKFMIKFKAPRNINKRDIIQFFKPLKLENVEIPWHGKQINPGFVDVQFSNKNDQIEGMKKNNRYFQSKKVSLIDYEVDNSQQSSSSLSKQSYGEKNQNKCEENSNEIFENGQIFFRNLPYTCTVENLNELFTAYGPLAEIKLPTFNDSENKPQNKGFGSCIFTFPEHALKAFKELDGSCFQGRILHILPGKQRSADDKLEADDSLLQTRTKDSDVKDFKELKEQNLKKNAQK